MFALQNYMPRIFSVCVSIIIYLRCLGLLSIFTLLLALPLRYPTFPKPTKFVIQQYLELLSFNFEFKRSAEFVCECS